MLVSKPFLHEVRGCPTTTIPTKSKAVAFVTVPTERTVGPGYLVHVPCAEFGSVSLLALWYSSVAGYVESIFGPEARAHLQISNTICNVESAMMLSDESTVREGAMIRECSCGVMMVERFGAVLIRTCIIRRGELGTCRDKRKWTVDYSELERRRWLWLESMLRQEVAARPLMTDPDDTDSEPAGTL